MPQRTVRRCFCEIEDEVLFRLARRKFEDGLSSLELLEESEAPEEKEAAACVALLDLPDRALICLYQTNARGSEKMLSCRRRAYEALQKGGVRLPPLEG